jgi:hypothetical protein
MQSPAIVTVVKMMESLPENIQNQVVEHLRQHIVELDDENQWDILFSKTQHALVAAAKRARQQILEGKAKPMEHSRL